MLITIYDLLLDNLEGVYKPQDQFYTPRDTAYERLKKLTNEDFGYDVAAWYHWFEATQPDAIYKRRLQGH